MITDAVQELKQNISPSQVIEYYTGQRLTHGKYLCPFHNDRNPSLTVKGDHWRCWSCGTKGDIFNFVQRYFDIGFKDALAKLSADFNVPVEISSSRSEEDRERIVWDRIKREVDQENRTELRLYLDEKIRILNICHRALLRCNAPMPILRQYENELDDLIQERSNLGEIDWRSRLTPSEIKVSEQLRSGENVIDLDLLALLYQRDDDESISSVKSDSKA